MRWELKRDRNPKCGHLKMRFARGRESQEKYNEICKGERISRKMKRDLQGGENL